MTTEKILVVDDEEAIREVISTLLEAQGFRCTTCSNGKLGLEAFRKDTFDLVLSDIVMPEMDGLARHFDRFGSDSCRRLRLHLEAV
jgi:CheY-like chemotaxis protein